MSVKKEKYYIAVSPNITASSRTVYRQARYGVKVVLNGIECFLSGFLSELSADNLSCYYSSGECVTEARTGFAIPLSAVMYKPEKVKTGLAFMPDVKVYPLITAKQMKQLQDLHVQISLARKGEG